MSLQENNAIAQILRTAAVFGAFSRYCLPLYDAGQFDGAAGSVLAAKVTLVLIALQVLTGGITVGLVVGLGALLGDSDRIDRVDERGRLFDLRALRVFLSVFGAGFVLIIIAMAFGLPLILAFAALVAAMHLGDIAANLCRLWLLRRGF